MMSYRAMAVFFLPLAAAQVFQTLRNPVLDAGISRAVDPETSLAAFAIVASVIQILSASGTAIQSAYLVLVRGRQSFAVIQRYMLLYMAVITCISTVFALPGIGEAFFRFAMGTPESLLPAVMTMMRISLVIPLFNLLRVFNLAQLAHRRRSHLIWVAPAVGQVVLITLGLGLVPQLPVPGIFSAAVVWVIVAVVEGLLAVALVRRVDRTAPYAPDPEGEAPLDFRYLTGFLIPLIITQFALTIGHPMVNAGLLRLPNPEATVGAFRLAFSLGMLPLTAMAALRQVVLVLGRDADQQRRARRFVYVRGSGNDGADGARGVYPAESRDHRGAGGRAGGAGARRHRGAADSGGVPAPHGGAAVLSVDDDEPAQDASGGNDRVLTAADDGVVPVRVDPGDGLDRSGRGGRGPDRGDGHGGSGGLPGGTSFCGNGFRYAGERQQAGVIPHGPLEVGG